MFTPSDILVYTQPFYNSILDALITPLIKLHCWALRGIRYTNILHHAIIPATRQHSVPRGQSHTT